MISISAIPGLTDKELSIKVLYPFDLQLHKQFENECEILARLQKDFQFNPEDHGVVNLHDFGEAKWQYDDNNPIGMCTIIVYTYGRPIFPILIESIQANNAKLVLIYFSLMVRKLIFI